MDSSSSALCSTTRVAPKECATKSTRKKHHPQYSSRRSPSVSSSSSLSSSTSSHFADEALSPLSPAIPLPSSGVPFSWEKLPGIPKKQASKSKDSDSAANHLLLPLPPSGIPTPPSSGRYSYQEESAGFRKLKKHHHHYHHRHHQNNSFRWDPFLAALVECSKDDRQETHADGNKNANYWIGPKVSRTTGDPFGIISLYSSCKRSCAVSESIIYLPRSNRRSTYDLINRHSH